MRLETDFGIPCIVLNGSEKLIDYELYVNGLRINDGLCRFTELLSPDSALNESMHANEKAYLILVPDFYRDSDDDRYNVAIDDQTGIDSRIEVNYSWSKRYQVLLARQGNIEAVDKKLIRGWYKNTHNRLQNTLELHVNGKFLDTIECIDPRLDVANQMGKKHLLTGFEFEWPENLIVKEIELKDPFTKTCVLQTPIVIRDQKDIIEQLERAMKLLREESDLTDSLFTNEVRKNMFGTIRNAPAQSFEYTDNLHTSSNKKNAGTSVLIPVYNSAKELKNCINSLLASGDQSPHEILLVNDCSPDKSIHSYLAEMQIHHPSIHVINSDINRGFVQTVNKAIAARRYQDIILLNSDTICPKGMIDRLATAHEANPSYGVLTPLSNNATIFSFPRTLINNPCLDEESLTSIDKLLSSEASKIVLDVPTSHGFCMFISGDVIDEVGILNAEEWGVGYAEENDYCQRVKMAGWGIGTYYGMYVGHVGSTSFGSETREELVEKNLLKLNALYPEYSRSIEQYISNDKESRSLHNNLQIKYFKQEAEKAETAIILHLSHDLGGGTEEYIRRCSESLEHDDVVTLKLWNDDKGKLVVSDLSNTIWCEYSQDDSGIVQLCDDLRTLNLLEIVLNSSFNFSDNLISSILSIGIPYSAVIHDYSWFCPKVTMIDARGSFCGMPDVAVCQTCIEVTGAPDVAKAAWKASGQSMTQWVGNNELLLKGARTVICPSVDTAVRIKEKFPSLEPTARYHSDPFPVPVVAQSSNRTTIYDGLHKQKIAVFGRIGQHKGMAVLKNLIWVLSLRHPGVQICFFGELSEYSWLEGYKNVEFVGEYEQDTLGQMIKEHAPTMALFLSVWPETYCYALTDAIKNGVFPIAFDIGAFQERVDMHNFGATIPFTSDSEEIYNSILNISKSEGSALIDASKIKSGITYPSFLKDNMGIMASIPSKVMNE